MRIIVLDGYTVNPGDNPWTPLEKLGSVEIFERTAPADVLARAQDAEILIINKIRMTEEVFGQLTELRLVAVTATGYDCVDLDAARKHDVAVCNVPEYSTDSVAQFVFSLLLHLVHNVSIHDQLVREGEWQRCGDFCFWRTPLVELSGRTIGIVGWGRIGRRVGTLAHAFGMNVLACSRSRRNAPDYGQFEWRDPATLFVESDVVSLHCPLTAETSGMVNAELLARMKPSAYLINTARGGLIVEQDLANALAAEQLAGVALDVSPQEPIHDDSPLLSAPCCVLTPHIAWATLASRRRCLQIAAGNIEAFLASQPRNLVT